MNCGRKSAKELRDDPHLTIYEIQSHFTKPTVQCTKHFNDYLEEKNTPKDYRDCRIKNETPSSEEGNYNSKLQQQLSKYHTN